MVKKRLVGVVLMIALAALRGPRVQTHLADDVVIEWNRLLQETIPVSTIIATRYYAMMHIAMFDAVNSIEREFMPYRVRVREFAGGSPEAAAAQAAHDVLSALIPAQKARYDAVLVERFGSRPTGFVRRGSELGSRVAAEILEWRKHDGWDAVSPVYLPPAFPGLWQPTPPNNPVATFTHLQGVPPMALLSATQFLPQPPPALTSEEYAADFNEVKRIGKSDSAERTPEQTNIAWLWAGFATTGASSGFTSTPLWGVWNNLTADQAIERGLSLVETARLFALVNVSMHDGVQTTQTSKYVYGLWRPVTAIRNAAADLNAATDPDPTWLSLLTTPPYPSYAGNMSCVGASAATALALAFDKDDIPIAITWHQTGGLPDVTHHFAGFWEAAQEQAMSRVYGGIHYQFDTEAGQDVGRKVAGFVFSNYMVPRGRLNE